MGRAVTGRHLSLLSEGWGDPGKGDAPCASGRRRGAIPAARAKELLDSSSRTPALPRIPHSPLLLPFKQLVPSILLLLIFFNCRTGKLKINLTRARTSFYLILILAAVLGFVSLGANTLSDGIFLCSGL